jgi:Methyltransferase domain
MINLLTKSKLVALLLLLVAAPLAAEERLPAPYSEVELIAPDYHGWFYNARQLQKIFSDEEPQVVLEVGSWLGKSTMWMAERVSSEGKVYAVDHWLGSFEHQPGQGAYHQAVPFLYQQFLSNVIHRGLAHKIIPVKMESGDAAEALKGEVTPDLIYIDGSHDYDGVTRDLNLWYPYVQGKCVFCGDDWAWKTVRRAVEDFAGEHNLRVQGDHFFWRLLPQDGIEW